MVPRAATYHPRAPAERVLYQVVRDHFETFRAQAAGMCDGSGLPKFVQEEFEGFLRCGFLAGGFARFQCDGCRQDLLVPFSCKVLAAIERRVERLLTRRGVSDDEGRGGLEAWSEREPVLAGLAAASVQGRVALGPRAGGAVRRCGDSPDLAASSRPAACGPCHARRNGFDLHAGVVVPARDRARLERLCRYALRPPVADDRVRLTDTGQVLLELRHRWADGTTHLLFDPLELLERLAALTPRPRVNLVLYYGVLAAHAAWRSRLAPPDAGAAAVPSSSGPDRQSGTPIPEPDTPVRRGANILWAQLMARSFGFDVLACSRCGGRFRLIALIEHPRVVQRILGHLGLPCEVPAARPSRAPPLPLDAAAWIGDDLPAAYSPQPRLA